MLSFRSGYDVRDAFGQMEEGNATDTSSMWAKEILLIDDITKQSTSHLANKGIQANEAISCPGESCSGSVRFFFFFSFSVNTLVLDFTCK